MNTDAGSDVQENGVLIEFGLFQCRLEEQLGGLFVHLEKRLGRDAELLVQIGFVETFFAVNQFEGILFGCTSLLRTKPKC